MSGKGRAVLCGNCRRLVSAGVGQCPHCGARAPGLLGANSSIGSAIRSLEPVQLTIGFCVLLYLGALAFNPSAALQDKANLLSLGSPDPRVQLLLGATGGASWFCGQHWTLLTANFLHGSALHIFFNMLWLRNLGPISSQLFGPARFFVIFMLTGIGGFALSNWGDPLLYLVIGEPFSPIPPGTLGASASIFGLMGVLIGYGRREGGAFGAQLTRQLLTWAIALFVLGLVMSGVNNLAHLGGFITGYLLSFALPPRGQRSPERPIAVVAIFLAILTLASMAMSFISWWSYVFENEIPQCLY